MQTVWKVIPLIVVLALGAGCGDVPELQTVTSDRARAAAYPSLVDLNALQLSQPTDSPAQAAGLSLAARVAALRARGNRMRGAVIEPARKRSLANAVQDRRS